MQAQPLPLRDIHLPEAIGWWPPAIGWWLLALLIPLLFVLMVWLYKKITRKTALKAAKKLLLKIEQDPALDDYQKLCELSVLIRRTAISVFPRSTAASLTGEAWLTFLDKALHDQRFSNGPGSVLKQIPYCRNSNEVRDIAALFQLCHDWLATIKRQQK